MPEQPLRLDVTPPRRVDPTRELAATWAHPLSPLVPENPLDPTTGQDVQVYASTARNPVVKMGLDALEQGAFWTGWDLVAQNDYEGRRNLERLDERITAGLEEQFSQFTGATFDNSLRNLLWNGLVYGFAVAELIYGKRQGRTVLRGISNFNSFLFDFDVDGAGVISRIIYSGDRTRVEIPVERFYKFLVAPWPYLRNGNYYGQSELATLQQDVDLLEIVEEAMVRGVQYVMIRPIIHEYDPNQDRDANLSEIRSALTRLDSASVLSLPMRTAFGDEDRGASYHQIRVLEDRASTEGIKHVREVASQLQKRILRGLGLPDDLGMSSTTVGSLAKAKEEMNLFLGRVVRCQEWLADIVNLQLIPQMIYYTITPTLPVNYRRPRFQFRSVEEDWFEKMSRSIMQLYNAGIVTLDEARSHLDLGETPEELDTTTPPAGSPPSKPEPKPSELEPKPSETVRTDTDEEVSI